MTIRYITVTLDREAVSGREFQSVIHISPDGWSQSGEELGDTASVAHALFEALHEAGAFDEELA